MRVDAKVLAGHLKRIYVPEPAGMGIRNVALKGQWECAALSMNGDMLVCAPALKDAPGLSDTVYVNLRVLIGVLETYSASVELSFEDERMVLREPGLKRPSYHLLVGDVESCSTGHVERDTAEAIFARLPDVQGIPFKFRQWDEKLEEFFADDDRAERLSYLDPSSSVKYLAHRFESQRVVLEVGPESGCWRTAGPARVSRSGVRLIADYAEIPHHYFTDQPYRLTFEAPPLLALLRVIRDAPNPHIFLHGPDTFMTFSDADGFRWLLMPIEVRRNLL